MPTLKLPKASCDQLNRLRHDLNEQEAVPVHSHDYLIHPLQFIRTLRSLIDDNVTVTCDVGSHYIWMARYFRSYEPRRLLFSNGMQTLGVALPWGIAATLVNPGQKVVSISGDGGFLFSSMELETAVRLNSPLVHIVWRDGTYDMVAFQQQIKYGRTSGVKFGDVDVVKYAESFRVPDYACTLLKNWKVYCSRHFIRMVLWLLISRLIIKIISSWDVNCCQIN